MVFTVYILRSQKTGQFYTGYTKDLELRLKKHEAGGTRTTRHNGPWEVVHLETFRTKEDAIKREMELKKLKSRGVYDSLRGGAPLTRG